LSVKVWVFPTACPLEAYGGVAGSVVGCLTSVDVGNNPIMEIIEELDGVTRLADTNEDPVRLLWRMENEARLSADEGADAELLL